MAGYLGMVSVHHNKRSRWTVVWMFFSFLSQCMVLAGRGELRGQCPLGDFGEILVFLAWSMTMFYLVIGSTYRLSLLGVFSAPLVSLMLFIAAIPGVMEANPEKAMKIDPWDEAHAALSVLGYGALGLAAIASVMFMVLNKQLKAHHTKSGLFKKLPPVHSIVVSVVRLTGVGTMVLSAGIFCGLMMKSGGGGAHLWVAIGVWLSYAALLAVWIIRGMTPSKLALSSVSLFVISLLVFAAL
ncbi:Cytochrome C assembly protein [Rubritalea squalenifaciens DSM 18772]|uniref:Cytochrome C assembly protein n=2 Tax=Rubritalea TaxID=361050 RepID=A0A1M6HGY6_9BACT|nr:cytochrome c biogenesis protein CcsA [Rubritalea squalenifaciens]SHJ21404.1 Cytochrome C assembly protein [Rubritalea squalenifaciens DSM 18772]